MMIEVGMFFALLHGASVIRSLQLIELFNDGQTPKAGSSRSPNAHATERKLKGHKKVKHINDVLHLYIG